MLRAGALHSFRATASFRQLVNSETVLERYTEGGLSKYRELSSRPILGRQQGTLRLDYGLEDGRNSITAALGFSGGADYMSQLYPYILERRSASWEAEAAYMRKLVHRLLRNRRVRVRIVLETALAVFLEVILIIVIHNDSPFFM